MKVYLVIVTTILLMVQTALIILGYVKIQDLQAQIDDNFKIEQKLQKEIVQIVDVINQAGSSQDSSLSKTSIQ
jgi:hypothetical protein